MSYLVDFKNVSTIGLESSPVAEALAGLRANEARYFQNKYGLQYVVEDAADSASTVAFVQEVLQKERGLVIGSRPLQTAIVQAGELKFTYVFYESGLAINVMYDAVDPKKRAVGFKLSQGMAVPAELETKFKFARQKSKLAGEIRGSFFVIKGTY